MFREISFAAIPQIYPKNTRHRKNRLFPFVVFPLRDFKIDIGHEMPKLITIIASNIDGSIDNTSVFYMSCRANVTYGLTGIYDFAPVRNSISHAFERVNLFY